MSNKVTFDLTFGIRWDWLVQLALAARGRAKRRARDLLLSMLGARVNHDDKGMKT